VWRQRRCVAAGSSVVAGVTPSVGLGHRRPGWGGPAWVTAGLGGVAVVVDLAADAGSTTSWGGVGRLVERVCIFFKFSAVHIYRLGWVPIGNDMWALGL
jgi:hypothetical protein